MYRSDSLKTLAFLLVIILTGCSVNQDKQLTQEKSSRVVGFSIYSTDEDYTAGVVDAFMKIMDQDGTRYIIKDANGDPKKQISDIESLVGEKVDAICILPLDEKLIRNSLNQATQNGIPIISVSQISWVDTAITISGGDYANGKTVGLSMKDTLNGSGDVVIMDYTSDISRFKERQNGFMDAIKDSQIKVVDTIRTSNTEETMDSVLEILNKYPNIKGIFATNSFQIIGCGAALKALGRKDIVVTGIGSEKVIIDMIMEGYVTAVAAMDPSEYGDLTAYAAIKLLRKTDYAKNYNVSSKIINNNNAEQMYDVLYNTNLNT